jgi:hypothetical protein
MPKTSDRLVFKFLRELNSREVQGSFQSLGTLLEFLENKEDPDPIEMQIVDTAYNLIEQLKLLEGYLKKYATESDELKGSKLQNLYDKSGSSVLFD